MEKSKTALPPLAAFMAVFAVHVIWYLYFPAQPEEQSRWASFQDTPSMLWDNYRMAGEYWMGYAYSISAAFAAYSIALFLKNRNAANRNAAIGGITLTGGLAAAGCFLIGCCGSPMLAVWLGLFGASVLPFTKPLTALLTTLTVAGAWWWIKSRQCDCTC